VVIAADRPVRRFCWFCRLTGLVCPKLPRGSAGAAFRRVMGRLLRKSEDQKSKALLSAPYRISSIPSDELGCRTAGCERSDGTDAGCRATREARDHSAANTAGIDAKKRHRPRCLCRQRGCAQGVATARQSSFSQLKLSEKQAKANFHFERRGRLYATSSLTLSNSTNGSLGWQ
jgi:hypothetical protein